MTLKVAREAEREREKDSPVLEESKFPLLGDLLYFPTDVSRQRGTRHHDASCQLLGTRSPATSPTQLVGVQVCSRDCDWGVERVSAIRIVS